MKIANCQIHPETAIPVRIHSVECILTAASSRFAVLAGPNLHSVGLRANRLK